MNLVYQLAILVLLNLLFVFFQYYGDIQDWQLPWYFFQEVFLIGIPMVWLLIKALPATAYDTQMAFITTSAVFVILGSIFELIAIQNRYWWFYDGSDIVTGLKLAEIPIEEFLYYPLILNIPVLFYIYLSKQDKASYQESTQSLNSHSKLALKIVAGLLVLAGIVLLILGIMNSTPVMDYTISPSLDEATGLLTYAAGPKRWGWTMVQLISTGIVIFLFVHLYKKLNLHALVLLVTLFMPYAFYLELMACGRGWWVWNSQQVIGIFTWNLPIDSYLMYFTGAMFPTLFYVWIKPFFQRNE